MTLLVRGRTIDVDGNDHRWLVVVVIDRPAPPAKSDEAEPREMAL
jgi:hypothetical protein